MSYTPDVTPQLKIIANLIADPMPPVPPMQRLTPRLDAVEIAVAALQIRTQNRRADVGALALGLTKDVAIVWGTAFADTNYNVLTSLAATATLLSAVVVQGVLAKTTTGCTVRVKATGILATGVTLEVTAIHD